MTRRAPANIHLEIPDELLADMAVGEYRKWQRRFWRWAQRGWMSWEYSRHEAKMAYILDIRVRPEGRRIADRVLGELVRWRADRVVVPIPNVPVRKQRHLFRVLP